MIQKNGVIEWSRRFLFLNLLRLNQLANSCTGSAVPQ
jgi:hypothetical protein